MSSFTPGPWKASPTYPLGDFTIHAAGIPWQLAYLARSTQIEWPLEANARLIAAAPELLEVAQRCLAMVEEGVGPPNWDWIREVIAKATTP